MKTLLLCCILIAPTIVYADHRPELKSITNNWGEVSYAVINPFPTNYCIVEVPYIDDDQIQKDKKQIHVLLLIIGFSWFLIFLLSAKILRR